MKPEFKPGKITPKGGQAIFKNVRIAFVSVSRPSVIEDSATYQVTGLIPEGPESKKIEAQVYKFIEQVLKANQKVADVKSRDKAFNTAKDVGEAGAIFKPGDNFINKNTEEPYDGFPGHLCFRAKSNAKQDDDGNYSPVFSFRVVDTRNKDIPRHEWDTEVYSGVWADVAVNFSPYGKTGATPPGVSTYLIGIMKLKDDSRLGASSPFESRDDVGAFDSDEVEEEEVEEAPAPPKKKTTPKKKVGKR
jgi:hypothetical protein